MPNIIGRLTSLFERKGHRDPEKWKIACSLADTIDADPQAVPTGTPRCRLPEAQCVIRRLTD